MLKLIVLVPLAGAVLMFGLIGCQQVRAGVHAATGNTPRGLFAVGAMASPSATIMGGTFNLLMSLLCLSAMGKIDRRLDILKFLASPAPPPMVIDPEDPQSLLDAAARWERAGEWERAIELYGAAAKKLRGEQDGVYAENW